MLRAVLHCWCDTCRFQAKKGLSISVFRGDVFWSARKAIPSQCLCSWQLATEAQSITRLTPFKKQPAGIELDGTYNKQQNENNKQQAVGITS
jgi:hypothetical protein